MDADQMNAWLVLDHLADAIETGHADVMAKSLALEAPAHDKAVLDTLQKTVYANGARFQHSAPGHQMWYLDIPEYHATILLHDEGRWTTVMIEKTSEGRDPRHAWAHAWLRYGKPTEWQNGSVDRVSEFLRAFRAQQANTAQVA